MVSVAGTRLHLAPDTALAIDTSGGPDETPLVLLRSGHLKVSNIDHAHTDLMHVQAGPHTFTVHRAEAIISHDDEAPQAILIAGHHVGVLGQEVVVANPGQRLHLHAGGARVHVPGPGEVEALLDRVQGPSG